MPTIKRTKFKLTSEQLLEMFYWLKLSRAFDERLSILVRQGKVRSGVYTGIGQEAIIVGSCFGLRKEDWIFPLHRDLGAPSVAIYNAGAFAPGSVLDTEAAAFERCWRILCLGGFLVGQRAARHMVEAGRGTILFTGATASLRGGANFANLAVGKFGLRAVAQSMARELGPKGVHVAHVIIDGQIRSERYAHLEKERAPDGLLDPAAIAETYWQLHSQPRSVASGSSWRNPSTRRATVRNTS